MLDLDTWLTKVNFVRGNPFAFREADKEAALAHYSVEHPSYGSLRDVHASRSIVVAAHRGFGKSAARRLFADHCARNHDTMRPLLIAMLDWDWAIGLIAHGPPPAAAYLQELLRQVAVALAEDGEQPWRKLPAGREQIGQLQWLFSRHGDYLSTSLRDETLEVLRAEYMVAVDDYNLARLPLRRALRALVDLVREMGYKDCYVLLDRVDEMIETSVSWEQGARLLEGLFATLPFMETEGLVFRCFVPLEIVEVLIARRSLRVDRVIVEQLQWDGYDGEQLLTELLRERVRYYSDDRFESLSALATPDLRDLDARLVHHAQGSPRQLLRLCDTLLHLTAADSTDERLLIMAEHLERALGSTAALPQQGVAPPPPPAAPDEPARLRIVDGVIYRGDVVLPGQDTLPTKQRKLLQYLYNRRGHLCMKDEIIKDVWNEDLNDDGSLRKMIDRLIKFIEPDPQNPIYIQKVVGGHIRLVQAE